MSTEVGQQRSLARRRKERWRQVLPSAQQMELQPDAAFLAGATKTGTDVAKATGLSTSLRILLLAL